MADRADLTGHPIGRRALIGGALAAGGIAAAANAAPEAEPRFPDEQLRLWPGDPPGARSPLPTLRHEMRGPPTRRELWFVGVATPTLYVIRPARPNGIGLLTLPGGGYAGLAIQNEGLDIAAAFARLGYTMFVLAYRLPAEGWDRQADVPLQDAQRAMRLICAGAGRFGIDPGKLGVLGFSAGGHLAASLATAYGEAVYAPVDAADRLPARPAFAGLMYAVTTLEPPATHTGSRLCLLGRDPSPAATAWRSPLLHIRAGMPPCFLVHAFDDPIVPVACTTGWIAPAAAAGVPTEVHVLERGGHGFGVRLPDALPGSQWPGLFDRWARGHAAA